MTPIASSKEITVLGAGIVGVCCALSLIEADYKVTLIDKAGPGEATSFGNAGVISPWSCVPQCLPGVWKNVPKWLLDKNGPVTFDYRYMPKLLPWALQFFKNGTIEKVNQIADTMDMLMCDNITIYRRHLAGTGCEDLLVDSLYVNVFRGDTTPDLNDLPWKLRIDRGAPIEIIGRSELIALEPALSKDCQSAVIIYDQTRAASPGKLSKALAVKAMKLGAKFLRMQVASLTGNEDGTYVLQGQGIIHHCKHLVLAGGFGSVDLLKPLGIRLPLISERGYHAEFSQAGIELNHSIMDVAGKFVVSSMVDGVRAAGTTEFAHPDTPANYARSKSLQHLAKQLLPDLSIDFPKYWMGVRPSFPDNLPAIGELENYPNIFTAFGHSHYGMGMAPVTGRIIAGMISGRVANANIAAVNPQRFL